MPPHLTTVTVPLATGKLWLVALLGVSRAIRDFVSRVDEGRVTKKLIGFIGRHIRCSKMCLSALLPPTGQVSRPQTCSCVRSTCYISIMMEISPEDCQLTLSLAMALPKRQKRSHGHEYAGHASQVRYVLPIMTSR